jgi:hypothetical protein
VFYTAEPVVDALVARCVELLDRRRVERARVCDPAVGGGAFLLGAGRALEGLGLDRRTIVEAHLFGIDIDPVAAAVCEAALHLWAAETGDVPSHANVLVGDALSADHQDLDEGGLGCGFDLVIGNPPFQNQLGRTTARSGRAVADARRRLGDVAHRYADTATLFLVEALSLTAPGGCASLVMPQSFLSAGDAGRARRRLLEEAELAAVWLCDESLFDATVRVCAPILLRRSANSSSARARRRRAVIRFAGPSMAPTVPATRPAPPMGTGGWSTVVADLFGVPPVDLDESDVIGSGCRTTAGFRDQYYGISGSVREAGDLSERISTDPRALPPVARLVTSGLIEPGRCAWGSRTTRFARQRWLAPVVDVESLADDLRRWASGVLRPKVVVATQTKVLEPAVDVDGTWWPSVPVIAVVPDDPSRLWHIAAALLAPPLSAWAMSRHAGTALASSAIKLSASQVAELPAPVDRDRWDLGASIAHSAARATDERAWRAALDQLAIVMTKAYGIDEAHPAVAWWRGRVPRWKSTATRSETSADTTTLMSRER